MVVEVVEGRIAKQIQLIHQQEETVEQVLSKLLNTFYLNG